MKKLLLALAIGSVLVGCNSGGDDDSQTQQPTPPPATELPTVPPIDEDHHCSEFTILTERMVSEEIYVYEFDSNLCNNLDQINFNGDLISRWYFFDEDLEGFTQFYYDDENKLEMFHSYIKTPEIDDIITVSNLNHPEYIVEKYTDNDLNEVENTYPIDSEEAQLMIGLLADLESIEGKWFEATHSIEW